MKKRALFADLKGHLEKKHITLLMGARQVGKTTLLQQLQEDVQGAGRSSHYLTLEDPQILALLNEHPDRIFDTIPPIGGHERVILFIDEVQYHDNPSNFLKYLHDKHQRILKLVVTGSSGFYIDEKFKDSLAGRKRIFVLPTLTFAEFLQFRGFPGLTEYVNSGSLPTVHKSDLARALNEYLIYGGYPEVVLESDLGEKQAILKEIADSYVKKDALEANLKYPEVYMKLLKLITGHPGLFNTASVAGDLGIDRMTVEAYLHVMQKSFHISRVSPFFRNVSKELRKMPKLYLNDLGLRNYFLNDFSPLATREDRGDLFENYVFRSFLDRYPVEDIRFWRTQKGQEVDFILEEKRAYEVKYSKDQFKPSKYTYFQQQYPNIPLTLIHKENILELEL